MNKKQPWRVPYREIALLFVIVGMLIGALSMFLSSFDHDEVRERDDLRRALQELESARKQ